MELATLEWVSWFNHHRLLEAMGYIRPAEAEANDYRQFDYQETAAVARLKPTGLLEKPGRFTSTFFRWCRDCSYAGVPHYAPRRELARRCCVESCGSVYWAAPRVFEREQT